MTIVLGAVTPAAIVVAADGFEFQHAPGVPKKVIASNRHKLFPVPDIKVVLAVHGQNKLAPIWGKLDSQQMVLEMLPSCFSAIAQSSELNRLAEEIRLYFDDTVCHTFRLLEGERLNTSELRISLFGYDALSARMASCEIVWPLHAAKQRSRVDILSGGQDKVRIIHGGTGGQYAEQVIKTYGKNYSPNRLIGASSTQLQSYVRLLYKKADQKQPSSLPEFGGDYHELTINGKGWHWTPPPA